jgi:hypothetical protein
MESVVLNGTGKFARWHFSRLMSGAPRAAMLGLIVVALGVLSLRATCAIAFADHSNGAVSNVIMPAGHAAAGHLDPGGAPSASCCDRAGDATLVKPADLLASWTRGAPLGIVFFASAGMLSFARRRIPQLMFPFAALPERSYYARSARIQR